MARRRAEAVAPPLAAPQTGDTPSVALLPEGRDRVPCCGDAERRCGLATRYRTRGLAEHSVERIGLRFTGRNEQELSQGVLERHVAKLSEGVSRP